MEGYGRLRGYRHKIDPSGITFEKNENRDEFVLISLGHKSYGLQMGGLVGVFLLCFVGVTYLSDVDPPCLDPNVFGETLQLRKLGLK